jgi:hypothetical protein
MGQMVGSGRGLLIWSGRDCSKSQRQRISLDEDFELRGRIRRGILKVEQLHAFARDVFYAQRGPINARELWEQMNKCSCLTLILACIVYWQAREISPVLSHLDPAANGFDLSLLEHISPHRVGLGQRRALWPIHPGIGSSSAGGAG